MDNIPKVGHLISDQESKDAIHIAVAPVIAAMDLHPGEHIGFTGNAFHVGTHADTHIGIVDPYFKGTIPKGARFYMFMYPQTITSLRHEWTHPAFAIEESNAAMEPTFEKLKGPTEEQEWIEELAGRLGTTYDELMDAAENYISYGEYFSQGGKFEGEYIPDEFWDKYVSVTRKFVPEDRRGSFLSCSC